MKPVMGMSASVANLLTTAALSVMNGNVGIGTWVPGSTLGVSGNMAIGGSYAAINTVPSNSLLVQGNLGIGTIIPGIQSAAGKHF